LHGYVITKEQKEETCIKWRRYSS